MGLTVASGFSQHHDAIIAAKEAAEQARNKLSDERIDLILLLSTPNYDAKDVFASVKDSLKNFCIIGGSTAGIIMNDGLKQQGVAVFAFHSDSLKFQTINALHLNLKNLEESGSALVQQQMSAFGIKDRKFLLLLFDGLLENFSAFTRGIHSQLGAFFPIIGAGTSDQLLFSQTTQYHDRSPASKSSCGVIVGGDVSLCLSCKHGWKPLGKPRLIKKSHNNIIEMISGAPAFQIYEDFFKDHLGSLKNDPFGKISARYPLGTLTSPHQEYLLHNAIEVLEDGSIACQDVVNEGSEVHIMLGNKNSCLQSAGAAAKEIQHALKGRTPQCLFIFESAMRWQILKHSWKEEFKIIKQTIGDHFPMIGMLTYGEIFNPGTLQYAGKNSLLNGNIILLAIV